MERTILRGQMLQKVFIFILALGLVFCAGQALGQTTTPQPTIVSTSSSSVINVHIDYNAYGVANKSTQTSTTTTVTTDDKGGKSTEVSSTVTTSTWHGGSLKADQAVTTINSNSTDGSESKTTYTDNYNYTSTGDLSKVSGGGSMTSKDGETGHVTSGTMTRSFIVKDGQAVLTNSTTKGTIKDKAGKQIGTFTNSTTIGEGDYKYLGGSWVPMKQVSTSTTTMATDGNMSSTETVTRTLSYTRNSAGVITGMTQTATGSRTVINGQQGSTLAKQEFTMIDYTAASGFDSKTGYYIKSEDYKWKEK